MTISLLQVNRGFCIGGFKYTSANLDFYYIKMLMSFAFITSYILFPRYFHAVLLLIRYY